MSSFLRIFPSTETVPVVANCMLQAAARKKSAICTSTMANVTQQTQTQDILLCEFSFFWGGGDEQTLCEFLRLP